MPSPNFIFAFTIATLIGAIAHFIVNGNFRRIIILLCASWIGFLFGNVFGSSIEFNSGRIGDLFLIPAIIGSVFMVIVAIILTSQRPNRQSES